MFVDETASFDGQYVGASAVIVTSAGRRSLKKATRSFQETLPSRGMPANVEIHAAEWVGRRDKFPGTNAFTRISALGDYLRHCSKCKGVIVINILVDTTLPGMAGIDVREKIWETLFWEFEVFLAGNKLHGHTIFDRDRVAQVVAIARRLQKDSCRRQTQLPQPEHSHNDELLQFADVCAYFTLQKALPSTQIKKAGATNYLDRIAKLCPNQRNPNEALVRNLQ